MQRNAADGLFTKPSRFFDGIRGIFGVFRALFRRGFVFAEFSLSLEFLFLFPGQFFLPFLKLITGPGHSTTSQCVFMV